MALIKRLFQSSAQEDGKSARLKVVAWVFVVGALASLICAISAPAWLPQLIRQTVPHSYIVAYAPEPVAEFIFSRDYETLPTIAPNQGSSDELLADLAATATSVPTQAQATGTAAPEITVTPTVTPLPALPSSTFLTGAKVIGQGWNRCGPTTLSMYLSYWGVPVDNRTQEEISAEIKPEYEDKNTSPDELSRYAQAAGFATFHRVNGRIDTLRRLIASGYPVIIERGFDELPEDGWMGHYMLLIGYNDADRTFAALDSYWTLKHIHPDPANPADYWNYDELDRLWRQFSWTYLVIAPESEADEIAAIIGPDIDDATMYYNAAQRLSAQLSANPNDVFGWFSLGTMLVGLKDYERAADAYDQARTLGLPFRMLWYQFGPYEAYQQVGDYDSVIELANWTLYDYPISEEAYLARGLVYQSQGDIEKARGQFQKALSINPGFEAARTALTALD